MLRLNVQKSIKQLSDDHRCYRSMMKIATTPPSKEGYYYKMNKFMNFCVMDKAVSNVEDFEKLLKLDSNAITDLLNDFVDWQMDKGDKHSTISSAMVAPEAFFTMNRKMWFKTEVRRNNVKNNKKSLAGKTPATDDDVFKMITYTASLRNKAVLHFLSSTGTRPAALVDPVLRMSHLISLPDISGLFESGVVNPEFKKEEYGKFTRHCYAIKVYDQAEEEYFVFLYPDAADALDEYHASRRRNGETLNDDTPIFGIRDHPENKYDFFTDDSLDHMLKGIIKGSKIPRKKVDNRSYDKAITYMFRKRFNGHLKMDNQVNSNIAEKLMAHKNGLDGTYLQPSMEQCYVEFFKAIPHLTPDPSHRHQLQIQAKEREIQNLKEVNETRLVRLEEEILNKNRVSSELDRKNFVKQTKLMQN